MRYKITANSQEQLEKVRHIVENAAPIRLYSAKRRMIAADDLSSQTISDVKAAGATVAEDVQYDLDSDRQ